MDVATWVRCCEQGHATAAEAVNRVDLASQDSCGECRRGCGAWTAVWDDIADKATQERGGRGGRGAGGGCRRRQGHVTVEEAASVDVAV